jgi:Flp pilus assembly protein TadG
MKTNSRSTKGTSLIESAVAAIVLIPIALAILDLIIVVAANTMNDTAAKNGARAACNQPDQPHAQQAAQNALSSFHKSSIIKNIDVNLQWTTQTVVCETTIAVHLPVPFPGFSDLVFKARDVEPVVAEN